MCNLSELIEEKGIEKGRIEGKEEGRIEGKLEGIIQMSFEFGLSEEQILERLQKKENLTLEKAKKYLKLYKEKTL